MAKCQSISCHLNKDLVHRVALALIGAMYFCSHCSAQLPNSPYATNLTQAKLIDEKENYYFRGKLQTQAPPDTKPKDDQWPVEQLPGNNWKFSISFMGDWIQTVQPPPIKGNPTQNYIAVRDAGLILNPVDVGLHVPKIHDGEDPNNKLATLPSQEKFNLSTEDFTMKTVAGAGPNLHVEESFVATHRATGYTWVDHGDDFDYYSFDSPLRMENRGGTTLVEASPLQVFANHAGEHKSKSGGRHPHDKWRRENLFTMGSDPNYDSNHGEDPPAKGDETPPIDLVPSIMSFDAHSRTVSISPTTINMLDRLGGNVEGIASEFLNDPLMGAVMQVSPMTVLENDAGKFSLSGGEVRINNPATGVALSAQFDEMNLSGGVNNPFASVGWLQTGSFARSPLEDQATFLDQFIDEHVLPPEGDGKQSMLGLFLNPAMSLVEATKGFTESVEVPLAMFIDGLLTDTNALVADLDGDLDVDRDDLLAWQSHYGESANGSGLLNWQREIGLDHALIDSLGSNQGEHNHLNSSAGEFPIASTTAVPEPGGFCLLLAAGLISMATEQRRRVCRG